MALTTARNFYYNTAGTLDQTFTGANIVKPLINTGGAGSGTSASVTYTTTTANQQKTIIPGTANSTAGDTTNNNGWAFNNSSASTDALGSTASDQRVIPAGTWQFADTLNLNAPALLATVSATITYKVYRVATGGGTRTLLFSVTSPAYTNGGLAAADVVQTTSSSQSQFLLGAGEVIMVGLLITSQATANTLGTVTNTVITHNPGANGVTLPTPGVRTQFNRTPTDSVSGTDAVTQNSSHPRTTTETITTTEAVTRAVTTSRGTSDSVTGTDAVTQNSSHPRTTTDSLTTSETVSRIAAHPRTLTDTYTTSDVVVRAFTGSRTITDTVSTSDSVSRLIIYGRFTYEYPLGAQPDYKVDFPTKHIAGFVRNSDGSIFYGGASMQLIRDSDNKVVQTQISSTVDGSYSFVRDQYDPNTYHVAAFYPSAPEQGITQTGLVPV